MASLLPVTGGIGLARAMFGKGKKKVVNNYGQPAPQAPVYGSSPSLPSNGLSSNYGG